MEVARVVDGRAGGAVSMALGRVACCPEAITCSGQPLYEWLQARAKVAHPGIVEERCQHMLHVGTVDLDRDRVLAAANKGLEG
jgi:hypothetical protein